MDCVKSDDQRKITESEWWDDWWRHDWSWNALKDKNWIAGDGHINGADTIQDYWRTAPSGRTDPKDGTPVWTAPRTDSEMEASGELVRAPDGRLWHIAHMPLRWGTNGFLPSPKADKTDPVHEFLNVLIGERLAAGRETKFRSLPDPIGHEGRAILYGIVWPEPRFPSIYCGSDVEAYDEAGEKAVAHAESEATLHVQFSRSWLGSLDAWRCHFGSGASFFHVFFGGKADFTAGFFAGRADFNDTIFAEEALFNHATLLTQTRFDGTHFMGQVGFHATRFGGLADFLGTQFWEGANFQQAEFSGNAHFHSARFLLDCTRSENTRADFQHAIFSKRAFFGEARFLCTSEFISTKFLGDAKFNTTQFSERASFESAVFANNVQFDKSLFGNDASFSRACFSGDAHFLDVIFEKIADFGLSRFLEGGFFSGATFKRRLNFETARFSRVIIFSDVKLPLAEVDWRRAFNGALFEFALDLQGIDQKCVSVLSGATVNRGVLLTRNSELVDNELHAQALQLALKAEGRENALRALEGGAQKFKLAMERDSDKLREQRFYRLELRSRRKQDGTPWTEKLFSGLYAATANYGASIGRPLLLLFVMVGALAGGFYGWDFIIHPKDITNDPIGAVWQALDFSWSNVFKPFMALSTQGDLSSQNPLAFRLLHDGSRSVYMTGFIVRAVSTFQSIIALALAFLVALAVRRRFQIS